LRLVHSLTIWHAKWNVLSVSGFGCVDIAIGESNCNAIRGRRSNVLLSCGLRLSRNGSLLVVGCWFGWLFVARFPLFVVRCPL
jgi:hypothetical protein